MKEENKKSLRNAINEVFADIYTMQKEDPESEKEYQAIFMALNKIYVDYLLLSCEKEQ